MMKLIIKILFLLSIILQGYCYGQKKTSKKSTQNTNLVTLKFSVKDSLSKNLKRKLLIKVYENYSATGIIMNSTRDYFEDLNQNPIKKITLPSKVAYLELRYYIGQRDNRVGGQFHQYRINAGANFEVELYSDTLIFKGKGSNEMNIQTHVFSLGKPNAPSISKADPSYYKLYMESFKTTYTKQFNYIHEIQNKLRPEFYRYLIKQVEGYYRFAALNMIFSSVKADKNGAGKIAIAYYKSNLKNWKIEFSDSDHQASYLMDYLFLKEMLDFQIESDKLEGDRTGAPIILDRIVAKYKGLVRERLLFEGIMSLSRFYLDADGYLSQRGISPMAGSPYFKLLNDIRKNFSPNSKALDFALPDSSGKILHLSDFKGKTVLLDFWFTGCKGCAELRTKMQPVFEKLSKNKKVVFISISIDSKADIWKSSLKSGVYTHDGSVNLLAGPRNPIVTDYNIIIYPKQMLIDPKGNLVAKKIQYPNSPANIQALIKLLEMWSD